ncbi:MAG: DUF2851 family protein [Duncaniella sp.]|nr:DUF2851 family protein [Duncaniella sp.]
MERLMQYVWQHRLLLPVDLKTVDGRRVSVIDPGRLNTDAGPDFFNAKIRIDGHMWVGDVEIHVRASDWHRHGHDGDPAYDSVVLHVVDRDDTLITRRNGETIPQMVMACAPEFNQRYNDLVGRAATELPCAAEIAGIPPIYISDWLTSLAFERCHEKSDRVLDLLSSMADDWESACYITVARALGFGINGEPMERLARAVPLRILHKHADSIEAVEALLFGQSGLLDRAPAGDGYTAMLRREHAFYVHKFGLQPPQPMGWKMARMRPPNFPHRRIALLAALVTGGYRLLDDIIHVESAEKAIDMFRIPLKGYWSRHFTFGPEAEGPVPSTLSRLSAMGLIINAVVPLIMAYGRRHGDDDMWHRGFQLLTELPPENNSIISLFATAGMKCRDASASQALIQLRRSYCEPRKCLYCRLGHRLLAARARR